MIIDIIPFNRELDLLEIRLNVLKDVVDAFVIVELNKTHQGHPKRPALAAHRDRFKDFPINHRVLSVPDSLTNSWAIENWHRRQLKLVAYAKSRDVVILSDLDEIPNPDLIANLEFGRYVQKMYYFYLNAYAYPWYSGTVVMPGSYAAMVDWQEIRTAGHAGTCSIPRVENGGWHFSSVGTKEDIIAKFNSFAHIEFDLSKVMENYSNFRDVHGAPLTAVKIDDSYPMYLRLNKDKYNHLIYDATVATLS